MEDVEDAPALPRSFSISKWGKQERDRGGEGEGRSVCVLADNFWMGGIHNKLLEFCTRFYVQHAIIVKLPSSAIATGMLFYIIVLIVACHDTVLSIPLPACLYLPQCTLSQP